MFLISSFSCLCSVHWSQVLSRDLCYQQLYCLLRCDLYYKFYSIFQFPLNCNWIELPSEALVSDVSETSRLSGCSNIDTFTVMSTIDPHPSGSYCNTLRLRQNCRHFTDNIFKCIFLNENVWMLLKSLLKFVPKVGINDIPALVQIMAWRRPMMVSLLMHKYISWPQWVQASWVLWWGYINTSVWI